MKKQIGDFIYDFEEISYMDLQKKRLSNDSFLILKKYDKLYITDIEFYSTFHHIKCHKCNYSCKHLTALKTKYGGCDKVFDRPLSSTIKDEISTGKEDAIMRSSRIEKYSFITEGIESVNTVYQNFVVFKCNNYSL